MRTTGSFQQRKRDQREAFEIKNRDVVVHRAVRQFSCCGFSQVVCCIEWPIWPFMTMMRKDPDKHIVISVNEVLTDASLDVVWMMQTACFSNSLMKQKHRSDSLKLHVDNLQSVAWHFFGARLDAVWIKMCTDDASG